MAAIWPAKVKSSIPKSLSVENTLPQNVGSIINYLIIDYLIIDQLLDINYLIINYVLKQPNGELLVAVNHHQLRTMASET